MLEILIDILQFVHLHSEILINIEELYKKKKWIHDKTFYDCVNEVFGK